jgi:hypothetical protein
VADHLTYYITGQMLVGTVHGIHFQTHAVSGGRAGRIDPVTKETLPSVDPRLANNVWRTDKKGIPKTAVLGGPIPCGDYLVTVNRTENLKLDLIPRGSIPIIDSGRRTNLQIHCQGFWGSYGCIVLEKPTMITLHKAVAASADVRLSVVGGDIQDLA